MADTSTWKKEQTLGHVLEGCNTYQWSLYKDHLLYLLVRAVLRAPFPAGLQRVGGAISGVMIRYSKDTMLVDQLVPMDWSIAHQQNKVVIYGVACAWDPLEKERRKKAGTMIWLLT